MICDFELLLKETAAAFRVEPEDILGPRRTQTVSLARHVVMALWADHHPYQEASSRCNRGCHSTSMWARQRILNAAETDKSFAALIAKIARRCQNDFNETEEAEEQEEEKIKFFSVCA